MLKRDITYEDYNGKIVTEVFYFNLSKSEMVEMELSTAEGFSEMLQRIVEAKDNPAIIATFKKLILASYGEKSEDGKRFDKNDDMRLRFSQTAAYDALFMELATNSDVAAIFVKGIVPADMGTSLDQQVTDEVARRNQEARKEIQDTMIKAGIPVLPPPPPTAA